jgi:4-amino-4-deoxy-L-arabinose transferase-like glycosyltransferase
VLHTRLVEQISARPLGEWITPEWPPGWYMRGLYREHPVGILVPAALLARLGYPAEQAAYAVNALYQVLGLLLIQRLAVAFTGGLEARSLGWLVQLLPIAFSYRIRANHESALLLGLLLSLYATERSRAGPWWASLTAAAFAWMALVKGLLAVPALLVCAAWLAARGPSPGGRATFLRAWTGLALASMAFPVTAAVYEALYRLAAGEPFLTVYLSRQLGLAEAAHTPDFLAQKAYNVAWYAARLLWFAFPWSLAALAAAWTQRRALAQRRGLLFCLGVAVIYLGLFSLSDRKADRYLFPAYYALGCGGAVAALRCSPALRRVAERLDRGGPLIPVAVWVITFALHVLGGWLRLPRIKLWPS